MNKTFFFDLDGTLLGMDQEKFLAYYFGSLKDYVSSLGHDYKVFFYYLDLGTKAMMANDGTKTNEEAFFEAVKPYKDMDKIMTDYYLNHFDKTKESCYTNPYAKMIIDYLYDKGYKLVLATQPLFPRIATLERIKWAGLDPNKFSYITTYENSTSTKPNKAYFDEIVKNLDLTRENIVYTGNDVYDDYDQIGPNYFESYLITDCLINKKNKDIKIKKLSLEEYYNEIIKNY